MAERIDQALFDGVIAELREVRLDAANQRIGQRFNATRIELGEAHAGVAMTAAQRITASEQTFRANAHRLVSILPLAALMTRQTPFPISLHDAGLIPGAAFCDNRPEYLLIPDAEFLNTAGHRRWRETFARKNTPWAFRRRVAFWRGGTSGRLMDQALGWRSLPRVRLCQICEPYPELFAVGLNRITQWREQIGTGADGWMRQTVPDDTLDEFRFLIDIDGNSNAWSGLFRKLLSGSPVLKVASPRGYRQWYYDRLVPWLNYVPVASDMSDLVDQVRWLREHDDHARCIGEAGRELALSLDYDGEVAAAARAMDAMMPHADVESVTRP